VQLGQEVLQRIVAVGTTAHDEPAQSVTVSACGMTNHKGALLSSTRLGLTHSNILHPTSPAHAMCTLIGWVRNWDRGGV
jgi:hypothetical protein